MAIPPQEIVARRGEKVFPKWQALLRFIANTGIVAAPGIKVTYLPTGGTLVESDASYKAWGHPFKVSASSESFSVRSGLVNGLAPYLDGVRITGVDDEGKKVDVPRVEIKHKGDPITYISLVVVTPEGGSRITLTDSPETLYIKHSTMLPEGFREGGSIPFLGETEYPLAALYWEGEGVLRRKLQIVHHNLGHRYIQSQAQAGISGRHLFWAA